MERYCEIGDCDRIAFRDGKCATHVKQLQRTGKTAPIAEQLTEEERAIKTFTAMLEADSDEDYDRTRRASLLACKALGKKETRRAIRDAIQAAKARGVHVGRPPKVALEEIQRVFALIGSVSITAAVLRLSKAAVSERLASVRKGRLSERPFVSPRKAG